MRLAALVLLIAAPAMAADGFGTSMEFREDFKSAIACQPVEGRKVWKGKDAFYIQAYLFGKGAGVLDDEYASAIPLKDNTEAALAAFKAACA